MKKINILAIAAVFAVVFLAGCGLRDVAKKSTDKSDSGKENSATENQGKNASGKEASAESAAISGNSGDQFDQEAANIDKELGSLSDDEFSDKELSDSELGL